MEPIRRTRKPSLPPMSPAVLFKGFGAVSTDPEAVTYTCPVCRETPAPRARLWTNGETVYLKAPCKCRRAELDAIHAQRQAEEEAIKHQEKLRYTYGWLGRTWASYDYADFSFDGFRPEFQLDAFNLVETWADGPNGNLVLVGPPGLGKSHLLGALCNRLRQSTDAKGQTKYRCRFMTGLNLFGAISQAMNNDDDDYTRFIDAAKQADILFIDDIDKGNPTEFKTGVWHQIVDYRVNMGLPIAITANHLDELDKWLGPYVADRLYVNMWPVEFRGVSYRRSQLNRFPIPQLRVVRPEDGQEPGA